jgi:hypothetical protein
MFRLIGTLGGGGGSCASRYDFNGDGYPDFVLYNVSTLQTEIMYLNNNVAIGTADAPTLPAGWSLIDEDDFNGDGHPDYLLFNSSTGQTAIAYMNNNVVIGVALGPTLPLGWQLIAAGDFNGDCEPDYVVYYPPAHVTVLAYMNNNVVVGVAVGPALPTGFNLVGVADFNGDGNIDYLLFDPTTGQTEILYLNNNVVIGSADGPTLPIGWTLEGTADFNRDGKPDYFVYYPPAHVTVIAYMNNNVVAGVAIGPTLPADLVPSRDNSALCEFRLTPTGANALRGGGFGSFVVGCNYSTCAWSAHSNVPWITLIGTTSYSGPNTILYSVGANNNGPPRPGTISVVPAADPGAPLDFTVNQAGNATPTPTPGNLTGTWAGTMTVTAYCNTTTISNLSVQLNQNGSTITGTFSVTNLPCYSTSCMQYFLNQSGTIDNGTINGNNINFAMNGNSGGNCFGFFFQDTFAGTLDPDGHIRGNISAGTIDLHR